jgi:hypothetical protein
MSVAKLTLTGTYNLGGFRVQGVSLGIPLIEHGSGSVEVQHYATYIAFDPLAAGFPQEYCYFTASDLVTGAEIANGVSLTGLEYVIKLIGI